MTDHVIMFLSNKVKSQLNNTKKMDRPGYERDVIYKDIEMFTYAKTFNM